MNLQNFLAKVENKEARIGIVGLGYVGLPLMLLCVRKQFKVIGFDNDLKKVQELNAGRSYIKHISASGIANAVKQKQFFATTEFSHAKECDAILICVPTPLNKNREPDMQYIRATAQSLREPRDGQLIVLESTTYPGTTDTLLRNMLEGKKTVAGKNFWLAFSPEREDPGNPKYGTQSIPKVVGGYTQDCATAAKALYDAILDKTVTVSSTRTAEMTKLLENIFRSVNIALVNEMKMVCDAMEIDIWEVIQAAATKPFGFMPFYPGPGLGGHCIPVDPFYLTWRAREFDLATRFIELAGEINVGMHHYVLDKIRDGLNEHIKSVNGSSILILGVAYKSDVDDTRESPALPIIQMLLKAGAWVRFHDPYVEQLVPTRHFNFSKYVKAKTFRDRSIALTKDLLEEFDATVIVTAHSGIDYETLVEHSSLVVDCRNATSQVTDSALRKKIVKA